MAMVASLRQTASDANSNAMGDDDGQTVKLTLRLPVREASWLVEHARGAGLSYGTFLTSVIDGAPCPGSLAEAVRSLTESTIRWRCCRAISTRGCGSWLAPG